MFDTARDFGDSIALDFVRRIPVRPKGDVLEIACGTGVVTQRLRARIDPLYRIVATDISEQRLAVARENVKAKIDWRKADPAALPFKKESFGMVVCGQGVTSAPERQQLFAEARRVLVEGGSFFFNVWDDEALIREHLNAVRFADVRVEPFPVGTHLIFVQAKAV